MQKIIYRKQKQSNSCGHAVAQMIIEYFTHSFVQQKLLIKKCPPSKEGISLYDIRKILADYNIEAETYVTKDLDNIQKLPFKNGPLLLVVKNKLLTHFIILEKKWFGRYLVHDPAFKKSQWLSLAEIKKIWLGFFMTFTFFDSLVDQNKTKLEKQFPNLNRISSSSYFISLLISFIAGSGAIITGYFFRVLIELTYTSFSLLLIFIIAGFFLAVMILQRILDVITYDIIAKNQIQNNKLISNSLYSKIYFLKNPNANRIELLKIIQQVQSYFAWKTKLKIVFPFKLFIAAAYLVALSLIAWEFVIATIMLSVIAYTFFLLINKFHQKNTNLQRTTSLESTFRIGLLLDDPEAVIYNRVGKELIKNINHCNDKSITNEINSTTFINQLFVISTIAFCLSTTIIYILSIIKISSQALILEEVIPALLIVSNYWMIYHHMLQITIIKTPKNEIYEIQEKIRELFHNNFLYNSKITKFKVKTHNLQFVAGIVYGIVGKNSSGKTTLLKNIIQGKIIINNLKLSYDQVANCILLSSKTFFDFGTVYKNILLADNASEQLFLQNWKEYNLNKYLHQGKLKLQDMIYPNDNKLSNGQKQLINILRIFTRHDEICLIDEGLNALEQKLKHMILQDIKKYYQKKILIIVSHDQNVIKYTDKVIVFN